MTFNQFGRLVAQVMDSLPDEFRPFLDNVTVDIQEEPDIDTLRRTGFSEEEIAAGESLYGLFAPLTLPTNWSTDVIDSHDMPHRIFIFKRPLEKDFPDPSQLRIEIQKTVIHELAHHFGFEERDLEKFDDNPDPFS